jgi:hypothetical protein
LEICPAALPGTNPGILGGGACLDDRPFAGQYTNQNMDRKTQTTFAGIKPWLQE